MWSPGQWLHQEDRNPFSLVCSICGPTLDQPRAARHGVGVRGPLPGFDSQFAARGVWR